MIRRLYFHPRVILEQGRAYCAECGQELLPTSPFFLQLLSETPCAPGVASVLYDDATGVQWSISVWNCQAALVAYDATGRPLNVEIDPAAQDAVEALILHAVESQGAINMSGIYSPPDDLIPYLEAGKIRAKEA